MFKSTCQSGQKQVKADIFYIFASPASNFGFACSLLIGYTLLASTGAVRWGWDPFDLPSLRLCVLLLFISTLVGTICRLFKGEWRRPGFVIGLAGLAVILSGAYSYLFRFDGTLSLAEGEAYEPIPPAFTTMHKGPLAPIPHLSFTVTRVEPDGRKGVVHLVRNGVVSVVGTTWLNLDGAEISLSRAGLAPLVVVTDENGGELERSYVKLDLEPPGKEDSFMFGTLPYEFILRRDMSPAGNKLHLNVRRGKISIYDGVTAIGSSVPIQNSKVSFPEQRKFAIMRLRRQPGMFLFLATLVIFALCGLFALVAKYLSAKERRCRSVESSCSVERSEVNGNI